ncbi:toll/interleukin-1 receptor domain-containing adapter protein [Centropristis striata]|uniref:toll/interleukin-1 receptor domain-containing adapter protein n=1 Tax=Centropristis striata TaxID=184440 RepID=UPI0027E08B8D|nr:toll/interleukin-1 receptor domain-containing adapter protein [Centropristis striata]
MLIYWKDSGEALNRHDDVYNMHGWIQKLFKSRASSHCEQEAKSTKNSVSSSASSCSSSSSSSPGKTPSKPLKPEAALSSLLRLRLKYDVFVCHSSVHSDTEEAERLVSFLEASPRSLRCFLLHRDNNPGGAICTELCEAVQNSHTRALLITPNFLQDEWCKYMMYQVLAEAPMSNRIIPLIQNLSHSQYPQELRFYYYIDLSKNTDRGYNLVNKTVINYLIELVKKDSMDSSSNGLSGEDSPQKDKPMSKSDPAEISIPLEVIETKLQ